MKTQIIKAFVKNKIYLDIPLTITPHELIHVGIMIIEQAILRQFSKKKSSELLNAQFIRFIEDGFEKVFSFLPKN